MTAQKRPARLDKRQVEQFLRDAPAGSLDMLRVFADAPEDGGSFAHVASVMGIESRKVTRKLKALDKLFNITSGGSLVQRTSLRYELTPAGRLIGQDLATQHRRLIEAVTKAASKHSEAWIPVTSNCLKDLKRLQQRVERDAQVMLYPDPHRSADLLPPIIQRRSNRITADTFPYAMYSTCTDATGLREGALGTLRNSGPGEVMVTSIEPFRILADTTIFGDNSTPLKIDDLWDSGCQLVVPDGGAVRTFLSAIDKAWEHIREYLEGTDLECCLDCLRYRLVPNPAMIVHGLTKEIPDGYALYDISDRPELAAVTGVFHRPELSEALGSAKRRIWDEVWLAAQNAFSKPPTIEAAS